MFGKATYYILIVLNLVDAFMLDYALRGFGRIPSPDHHLHFYAQHLSLILGLRIVASLAVGWLVYKTRISVFNAALGLVAVYLTSTMIYENYMYLVLE